MSEEAPGSPLPAPVAEANEPVASLATALPRRPAVLDVSELSRSKPTLDWLSSILVPASICCYLAGFMVSVPFLSKAGVPIASLSLQTFLGAGLLAFIVLLPVPFGIHWYLAHARRQGLWRWLDRLLVVTPVFLLSWQLSTSLSWALLFNIGLWAAIGTARGTMSALRDSHDLSVNVGVVALCVATVCYNFGITIYPRVRVSWGGGRPEPILQTTVPPPVGAVPDRDSWAMVGCRTQATLPAPRCRTIYRVYEDSDYLFVAILETANACGPFPQEWGHWSPLEFGGFDGCYQRISHSEIPRLEMFSRPR